MLKYIKSISLFLISVFIVSITSYLYIYKGFIDIPKEKVIHKEKIINKTIKEKGYTLNEILDEIIQENKRHRISELLLGFIENNNQIDYNLFLKLKKESINQVNEMLGKDYFIENTKNEIYINISKTQSDDMNYVKIYGILNDKDFLIEGYYIKTEKSLVIKNIQLDGILTLLNQDGINKFLNDGFKIKYNGLIGKKINLEQFLIELDKKIPEIEKDKLKSIIIAIENFVKLNANSEELNFIFSDELKNTTKRIRSYILKNKNLTVGQKQNLIINLINLTKKLENTQIKIKEDEVLLKNEKGKYIFDFKIDLLKKDNEGKDVSDFELKSTKGFELKELYEYFLNKNKILVKYLNGEDFLFLVPDTKESLK